MVCRNYLQYACSHILSKLILAVKKKAHLSGTGGGPPAPSFTPAEELALDLNQGRPVMEGIQGGTATDCSTCRNCPPYPWYIFQYCTSNTIIHLYGHMWTV